MHLAALALSVLVAGRADAPQPSTTQPGDAPSPPYSIDCVREILAHAPPEPALHLTTVPEFRLNTSSASASAI